MTFNQKADGARQRLLRPWPFWFYLWLKLPLAACAGLRLRRLDADACEVSLPGGWRTQNPFRSTYFAAQAMAAEMSTGAPAMVLVEGATASVALLVREVRGTFSKKATGTVTFRFEDVATMAAVVERAAAGGDGETFLARTTGRMGDGTVVAEFEITWTFRRRQPRTP
jgi:hypothetical protein